MRSLNGAWLKVTIVSLLGRENAANPDVFGHNPKRSSPYVNVGLLRSWGAWTMLSVDQFLRLISVPAVVAAFLIASQISGAVASRTAPTEMAGE
jgi:hypothetical protein